MTELMAAVEFELLGFSEHLVLVLKLMMLLLVEDVFQNQLLRMKIRKGQRNISGPPIKEITIQEFKFFNLRLKQN